MNVRIYSKYLFCRACALFGYGITYQSTHDSLPGNVSRTGESIQDYQGSKDYLIPASCCRFKKRCTLARNITIAKNHTPRKGIYSRGCGILIDGHIKAVLEQAEVILLSDAALDVIGIICIWILFLVFRNDIAKEEAEGARTNV